MEGKAPRAVLGIAFVAGVAAFLLALLVRAPKPSPFDSSFEQRVRGLMIDQDWEGVMATSTREMEENGPDAEALFFLGEAFEQRDNPGDEVEADAVWQQILALTENLPLTLIKEPGGGWAGDTLWRGWALRRLGREDQAQAVWRAGVDTLLAPRRRGPMERGGSARLASMLGLVGEMENAWEHLKVAAQRSEVSASWARRDPTLEPLRSSPLFEILTSWQDQAPSRIFRRLMATKQYKPLSEYTRMCIRIDPMDTEAWLFQAFAYEGLGDGFKADEAWCGLVDAMGKMLRVLEQPQRATEPERRRDGPSGGRYVREPSDWRRGGRWGDLGEGPGCGPEVLDALVERTSRAASMGLTPRIGWALRHAGREAEQKEIWDRLADNLLASPELSRGEMYNAACYLSLAGRLDEAVDWLDESLSRGYSLSGWEFVDPDLEPIRSHPRYPMAVQPGPVTIDASEFGLDFGGEAGP